MKILITGKGGQLASELQDTLPSSYQAVFLDSNELDITLFDQVALMVETHKPVIIINAAAYTAVDKAETEQKAAYAVNDIGTKNLAQVASDKGIGLIHVSTDFVFNGNHFKPYTPEDVPSPISVYGDSKLKGEQKLLTCMPTNAVIVRTAWVYSKYGNNFVKTMLGLMNDRDELGIVYDQVGTPTWARGLALMIWGIIDEYFANSSGTTKASQIVHWTDAGVTSWYDFAVAIHEYAHKHGLLNKNVVIKPIEAKSYPTPASRPCYSVLNKSSAESLCKIESKHWQQQLELMIKSLAKIS
ncbi:dTDP-4-dehydrorhamnose reductase [Shewanella aestuarii]|uniref:dTDP-4-dehydrorhamnose reductase n=1 Tax=Shewanella aestuarii TaxID=1028752 RepID=A0A6G9QLY9_9GAMM|nr:dTDP-4-dehydrorhamnose reductase [Shewanella aestuarii]QIR15133.1 dTDP-4-dehydrorhamnose reductase [Shewanella aestuarii]